MQIDAAQICITEIFFNNIIDITTLYFFVSTMITKTRPWRHTYYDIGIPRPKNHDIEIPRSKNYDIKFRGLKHHDIEK